MDASSAYSFLLILCWCVTTWTTVESKPFLRREKRNSHSQNGIRRCGNDFDSTTSLATEYQYLSDRDAPRISKRNLSWKITRYPEAIDNHTNVESVNFAASQTLSLWSSVANLQFYQIDSGTPDIEIKFQMTKAHNRQCDWGFRTSTVAHYVPGSIYPGKIHFNEQFEWTTSRFDPRNSSVNLVNAIAHEVGHLLGFGHTIVPNSIMYQYYSDHVFTAPIALSRDDISVATNRYGVKVDSYETTTVPSTTPTTATAARSDVFVAETTTTTLIPAVLPTIADFVTVSSTTCNDRHMKTFFEADGYTKSVCATLYELDDCQGNWTVLPRLYSSSITQPRLENWVNRFSSMKIAHNCWARVCSVVEGNQICSANLTGMINSFDSPFYRQSERASCWCHTCPIPSPITDGNRIVCAVLYRERYCLSSVMVISPGPVWFSLASEYQQGRRYLSAQVNPNCTANFCQTETIDNHTCLTISGGVGGQSYPKFDFAFMRNLTSIHCSCVS